MSVIKRLQRLTGESPRQAETPGQKEDIAALRRRVDAILARREKVRPTTVSPPHGRSPRLHEVIPGKDCRNAAGICFIMDHQMDASAWHGNRRIGEIAGLNMQAASLLANDRTLAGCRIEEGLFLDTETTGLAGGTGTLAFLIGLGWFEGGRFIVRQIFARDFTEERAALTHLAEMVGDRRFLVSFNGKTFDVGLLSARYILNRLRSPFPDIPHLDLLYPARRLVAHRLENSRLSTIEAQVLGLIRQNDLPGNDIPQRYFDWLRIRDPRLLQDVFTHNRLDIISLAALMDHLTALTHGRRDAAVTDARDLLAVARIFAERQQSEQAESLLKSVIESHAFTHRMEARKMLSQLHKRAGRWDSAVMIWQTLIQDDPGNRFALIELAKWYEHRAHDRSAALNLVECALQKAGEHIGPGEREALLHRRRRLQQRPSQGRKNIDK
jgi:hypothetical protein